MAGGWGTIYPKVTGLSCPYLYRAMMYSKERDSWPYYGRLKLSTARGLSDFLDSPRYYRVVEVGVIS
jgi:hypothetical protein